MHEAMICETSAALDEALRQHVESAYAQGARCVVICQPQRRATLERCGTPLTHVHFHDAASTLSRLGEGVGRQGRLEQLITDARTGLAPQERLYAWGEMVDLLEAARRHEAAIALEGDWSAVCERHQVYLRCGYTFSNVAQNGGLGALEGVRACHAHHEVTLERRDVPVDVAAEQAYRVAALEAHLRALEPFAAVGLLTAGVVHDAAGPLSCVAGNIEELCELLSGSGAGEALGLAKEARVGVEVLHEVFADVRRASGRREPQHPVELVPVLERVLRLQHATLSGVTVALEVEYRPLLAGPSSRLYRLFANLIANACDAMASGVRPKRLGLSVRRAPVGVEVCVTDSGEGMDPTVAAHLFEAPITTRTTGTGLGLMQVKRATAELGGEVQVDAAPGGGTTVRVRLPVLDQPAPAS
jgi:signal transduction histidine kinase